MLGESYYWKLIFIKYILSPQTYIEYILSKSF